MTEPGFVLAEPARLKLQPEVMLPVQLWPRRPATPEEALISAVLQDAIECIRNHRYRGRRSRLYREAEDWFSSEHQDWPFSFENICAFLSLDADRVRRGVGVRCAGQRGGAPTQGH